MPDQFTETTTRGYGSRIIDSIKGILVGIVLFVLSFILLYWNEGRVDLSNIAKTAVEISSTKLNTDNTLNGKLVATSGSLSSSELLGDNLYLKPGKYLVVQRTTEMFAWIQEKKSESKKNIGGSETTTTTYTYRKGWTHTPEDSSQFKTPEDHSNPPKGTADADLKVGTVKTGAYDLDPANLEFPNSSALQLTDENTTLSQGAQMVEGGKYLYLGSSTYGNPRVGDVRIAYSVVPEGINATVLGKLEGNKISPFFDKKSGTRLYRAFLGDRDSAVNTLHSEYTLKTWLLRGGGFLMMWIGLSMLFGPISTLLDILPIFGSISRGLIGIITFAISAVLSVVAILVSMILHSLLAVLIAAIAVIVGAIVFAKFKKNKLKENLSPTTSIAEK